MGKKRRVHSAELKAKVAIEAIRGMKTASEIASEYGIHPVQVSQWKRKLLDETSEIFSSSRGSKDRDAEKEKAGLYEKIGRLEVELDWLKKKSAELR
ncbi:MAG: transposase [Holophagales bacterium]|nr:transposase [Holophagales bacterium]